MLDQKGVWHSWQRSRSRRVPQGALQFTVLVPGRHDDVGPVSGEDAGGTREMSRGEVFLEGD